MFREVYTDNNSPQHLLLLNYFKSTLALSNCHTLLDATRVLTAGERMSNLRAIVVGSGWAAEGHARALQHHEVSIAALCGRTPEPAYALVARLGIPEVRFGWQDAIDTLKPDIVCIATPAAPHLDIATAAMTAGCHVVCEKPLALTATEAHVMFTTAPRMGVRHAYAATGYAHPIYTAARDLILGGAVGQMREIESFIQIRDAERTPYSWVHQLEQGGGMLNNIFPHQLQQLTYVTGAEVVAATGDARPLQARVPFVGDVHDFCQLFMPLTDEQLARAEWREPTVDVAYSVVVKLRFPDASEATALVHLTHGPGRLQPSRLVLHGERGSVALEGDMWTNERLRRFNEGWEEVDVPVGVGDPVQAQWDQFFGAFLDDVRGHPSEPYPTFEDGWVAAEVIGAMREGRWWRCAERIAVADGGS
ncbi:putative dehydrogenase [Deinococcus peraridilitoris DSM 19664]|uniref:Putative dehydrogenase n=2 Tax=Deinococcus TaxID=1298 RepID=K9ZZS4_DEIPD|nr:putative dehydrogenase [Deinococcus peraridilitoris DSM 19664]